MKNDKMIVMDMFERNSVRVVVVVDPHLHACLEVSMEL